MKMFHYGHDFGNSDTCGVTWVDGWLVSSVMPSYTAFATMKSLNGFKIELGANDHVFKQGNEEFYVGDLAITQADNGETGAGSIARYWSRRSLILLLTSATSIIPDSEFRLEVVTGLPVETYISNEGARALIKELLENGGRPHEFTINGVQKRVYVHVERTLMEGAGAMIAYGKKEQSLQGVVDIGGRTIDLFASNGQKPNRPLCKGKPLGVESAAQRLSDIFEAQHHGPLKATDRRDILRAYISRGQVVYPIIYSDGHPVTNLHDLAETAINGIAQEIVSFIGTVWNRSEGGSIARDFAQVVLVGGGAYYFKDALRKAIAHMVTVDRPEIANALGYASFVQKLNAGTAVVAAR